MRLVLAAPILLAILMSGGDPVAARQHAWEMARKISAEGAPNMAEVTPRRFRTRAEFEML